LSQALIDQPADPRSGEELDPVAVDAFMRKHRPELEGLPKIRQFPGGASNLTYEVRYGDTAFVLRRPPFGQIPRGAHDMLREARVMEALKPHYPCVPTVIAACEDESLMGCSFFIMERLEGIILREDFPPELDLDPGMTRKMCLSVIDRLVELHTIDPARAGLEGMAKGAGYVERQITGWSNRYRKAMTDDAADFEKVMAWLDAHRPDDIAIRVIHNDFRFDNVVLDPEDPQQVIGILDWEMATLGDPLMDLGNTLAYWIEADDEPAFQAMRRQPTHRPGMLNREEVVDYYLGKSSFSIETFAFYEIYGLFRLAAIIQQIYYRYYHGQTSDRRFAGFAEAGRYLESRCLEKIRASGSD